VTPNRRHFLDANAISLGRDSRSARAARVQKQKHEIDIELSAVNSFSNRDLSRDTSATVMLFQRRAMKMRRRFGARGIAPKTKASRDAFSVPRPAGDPIFSSFPRISANEVCIVDIADIAARRGDTSAGIKPDLPAIRRIARGIRFSPPPLLLPRRAD
jgi:hypothetical protein